MIPQRFLQRMLPMVCISWTPSHSPDPLKQRHESWKPNEPKGTKVAPEFGEVEAKVELVG